MGNNKKYTNEVELKTMKMKSKSEQLWITQISVVHCLKSCVSKKSFCLRKKKLKLKIYLNGVRMEKGF